MNTKKILTQIKRELWENKIRFVYAPIVTTLLLVALMGVGVVRLSMSFNEHGLQFNGGATIGGGDSNQTRVDIQTMLKKVETDGSNVYDMVVSSATLMNTSFLAILFLLVLLAARGWACPHSQNLSRAWLAIHGSNFHLNLRA